MKSTPLLLALLLLASMALFAQADVPALISASEQFEREDNFPKAIDAISKAIDIQPDSADLYNRRALLYYGTANKDKAVADFKKAAELGPNDRRIVLNASRMLRFFDHCIDALTVIDGYIGRSEPDAVVFQERSNAKKCINDLLGAYEDMSSAIELDPKNARYHALRAAVLDEIEDSRTAFEQHAKLIISLEKKLIKAKTQNSSASLKRDLAFIYQTRARLHHARGETEAEFADLAKMIELEPTFYNYQLRADIFADHEMYREGVSDLTQAIRVSSHPPIDSLIRRAELHVLAANYIDAVKDYEAALKIEGLVNRGTIEQRLAELRPKIIER